VPFLVAGTNRVVMLQKRSRRRSRTDLLECPFEAVPLVEAGASLG